MRASERANVRVCVILFGVPEAKEGVELKGGAIYTLKV